MPPCNLGWDTSNYKGLFANHNLGYRLKTGKQKIEEPISERLDDAQRPGGGLGGGRLKGGVKCLNATAARKAFRSAPPPSRFFASFLADPRKEGPRQGPEV